MVFAPDTNSEHGVSPIPADSAIGIAQQGNAWVYAEPGAPGAATFGLLDQGRFEAWATEQAVSIAWQAVHQAIVDHAMAPVEQWQLAQQAASAEAARIKQVDAVTAHLTFEVVAPGLQWVSRPDGSHLGTVVNRGTPGGAWWAISPQHAAHDVYTAPTNGWGHTPRAAARGLVDLETQRAEG
jgi:hypothetical protein